LNYYHGVIEGENYGDEKFYCWNHKKQIVKKYKKEIIYKHKFEKKQALMKEKEEAKKAKQKEKAEAKEEKRNAKEDAKKNKTTKKMKQNDENIVLGPSIVVDETLHQEMTISEDNMGCIEILKSGPNKGKKCGCKVVSDNMCKRHKNQF
jgi:sRNA-binding protein